MKFVKIIKSSLFWKFIAYIIAVVGVSAGATKAGFPILYVFVFNIYILACLIFYIIIDLPAMKKVSELRGYAYIAMTFVFASVFYLGITTILPQFDPEVEMAEIRKKISFATLTGPEAIKAGEYVFKQNKCANCHIFKGKGSSMRGPHFDLWQVGLHGVEELRITIVEPRKEISKGFEDAKSKTAMPIYFGEEIKEDEMAALLAFLKTGWSNEHMPVRGKEDVGPMVRWDEDPEMIALGKQTYEGSLYPGLSCSVCHGKDGIPTMQGAKDLRDPNAITMRPGKGGKKLKDWTDADWFDSVSNGIDGTPMMGWLQVYPPRAIWLAIAYAKQFSKGK